MVYCVKIIAKSGIQIFEHTFQSVPSNITEKVLISGFFSGLTNFFLTEFADEMKEIYLGVSKFQSIMKRGLLFILHTDIKYPAFVGILKLNQLIDAFFEMYGEAVTSERDFGRVDTKEFQEFHFAVQWIFEQNMGETELIFEMLLAGPKIEYSRLINYSKKEILFSISKCCSTEEKTFFDEKLAVFQRSPPLLKSFTKEIASSQKIRYGLLGVDDYWFLELEYKNLRLFTVYNANNASHLPEIVSGVFEKMIIDTLEPFTH